MLLNKTKALALISGLALSGLVSACSNNQTAQSTVVADSSAVESTGTQSSETVATTVAVTAPLPAAGEDIGVEKAKEIALEKAGVKAEDTLFINAHLDRDDGRVEYDVEFQSGHTEYEVSVDAVTGAINEFSSEDINY
jgi:hypothetical protein